MRTFKIQDCSNGHIYAEIACGIIPQIGSKITIQTQSDEANDVSFRIRDLEYIFFESSNEWDCVIRVTKE